MKKEQGLKNLYGHYIVPRSESRKHEFDTCRNTVLTCLFNISSCACPPAGLVSQRLICIGAEWFAFLHQHQSNCLYGSTRAYLSGLNGSQSLLFFMILAQEYIFCMVLFVLKIDGRVESFVIRNTLSVWWNKFLLIFKFFLDIWLWKKCPWNT